MGPLQCGSPNPNLIPQGFQLAVIDLKDCFFSIPLQDQDKKYFAFTVPVLNNSCPTQRYQWTVLPQGMLNSPTLCQHYVNTALTPFRQKFPSLLVYHYMDDILVAAPVLPREWLSQLTSSLQGYGLQIAPEKVQLHEPFQYLGHKLHATYSTPILPSLHLPNPVTYVVLQQLLGAINWLRPYYQITTQTLRPLFMALTQGKHPSDLITLSTEQLAVLTTLNQLLAQRWVDRACENVPPKLICLCDTLQPCAIVAQEPAAAPLHILEWLYLPHSPPNTLSPLELMIAQLITKGRHRCRALFALDPVEIVLPLPLRGTKSALAFSDALQLALAGFVGSLSYHTNKDPRLHAIRHIPTVFRNLCQHTPIADALTVFTDGCPTRGVVSWRSDAQWHSKFTTPQTSPQRAELAALCLAFSHFPAIPLNVITDSLYVANVGTAIAGSYVTPLMERSLLALFLTLQQLLRARTHPFFIAHIRSHLPLPGALSEGNAYADAQVRISWVHSPTSSHAFHHQNAKALARQFSIPLDEAKAVVQQCPQCSSLHSYPPTGVNPRGLGANQLWQMDVTRFPPFSPWNFLHVTVDTYSGYLWATPHKGERVRHVINHFVRCFSVMGIPAKLKTDNGPAYCSQQFAAFCSRWGVVHTFGIPYNSQGQAIVERANRTLKTALLQQKAKEGIPPTLPDKEEWLAHVLYTINHLNLVFDGTHYVSRLQKHFRCKKELPAPKVRGVPQFL
uniref:Uncharacterized protein n=1 Tax=Gopherus agassizii TaxID=38772 RepID=A0A452GV37_9SAUR